MLKSWETGLSRVSNEVVTHWVSIMRCIYELNVILVEKKELLFSVRSWCRVGSVFSDEWMCLCQMLQCCFLWGFQHKACLWSSHLLVVLPVVCQWCVFQKSLSLNVMCVCVCSERSSSDPGGYPVAAPPAGRERSHMGQLFFEYLLVVSLRKKRNEEGYEPHITYQFPKVRPLTHTHTHTHTHMSGQLSL